MKRARCFMLLEVVVALALLAGLGVWLLKLQAAALHQYRTARQRAEVALRVERLLWNWSEHGTRVTLPATGEFTARLRWRRESQPVRVAAGVLPTRISVIVTRDEPGQKPLDIYRVDWLLPKPEQKRRRS